MLAKEKAHPVTAITERAERESAGSVSPCVYFTAEWGTSQERLVSAYLGVGEDHALTGEHLAKVLGLRDLRTLTQTVERERRAGIPICASVSGPHKGYYLASGPLELSRYVASLDRRLKAVGETRRRLGDVLDKMTGQQQIGLEV